jgi:hypothetical protein
MHPRAFGYAVYTSRCELVIDSCLSLYCSCVTVVERIQQVVAEHEERLRKMQWVPRFPYGRGRKITLPSCPLHVRGDVLGTGNTTFHKTPHRSEYRLDDRTIHFLLRPRHVMLLPWSLHISVSPQTGMVPHSTHHLYDSLKKFFIT